LINRPLVTALGPENTELATTVLVSTWADGLFIVTGKIVQQELAGQAVRGLAPDGQRAAIAIVGGHSLCRRAADGKWHTIASSHLNLSCCVAAQGTIYVGTENARVLCVAAGGRLEPLPGFDSAPGREKWYGGAALVDGRLVGPPLGIRSMSASCDGAVLFANVHVGGIPRSSDSGVTWQSSIDIDNDVHEVCAHPTRSHIAIAASAVGLCISRDAGHTWWVEHRGLHARYCSAVAFVEDDMLVAAAADHFAAQGVMYRRAIDVDGPMLTVGRGLPQWTDGIVDTGNIAVRGRAVAAADGGGNLYMSEDAGRTWSCIAQNLPAPSSLFIY
jgi:hypothetical protein